ncbi:WD40 repeat domain-containing protein [Nostoc sp.]|uniref:WD40 repeat domain-containing protein n=1 Tax=Nostoc sp. TaxID=1180 RepID=UPI002FFC63A1
MCCDGSHSSYEESQTDASIVDGTYLDFKKWDLKTVKSLRTINKMFVTRMKGYPKDLNFSANGKIFVKSGGDINIWNLQTQELLAELPDDATSVVISPDAQTLVSYVGKLIQVWRVP